MPIALDCRYRPRGAEDRLAIRDVHLKYMIAKRDAVLSGGASMSGESIIGMYVLLATDEPEQADAFLANEPYTQAGLFSEIRRTVYRDFIPEPYEGFLAELLAAAQPIAERLRSPAGTTDVGPPADPPKN